MYASLYWQVALTLVGGLGLFLLGMRMLSDGLQTVAGSRLKKLIAAVTNNRLLAVVVGVAVTTVIQSSSITTVLVVGFVNSGIMTLAQAVGVIMGANIGTTITGWILVLHVDQYGLPLAGVSALVYLFAKRDSVRYTAMAVLGIGLVFLGLTVMKDGLHPIRGIPEFQAWFQAFDAHSYGGVLKCVLAGCLVTMVVQSSSATLGITIAMASQGLIPFETGAALVLGENIGTTITALLASLGTGVNARRAAYFHSLFNVLGVAWVTAVFVPYLRVVEWFLATFLGIVEVRAPSSTMSGDAFPYVTAGIATVHSLFNVSNTILFLPVAHRMSCLLERLVPDRSAPPGKRLTKLDDSLLDSPFAALEQVGHELEGMGRELVQSMYALEQGIRMPARCPELGRQIFATEKRFDTIQAEVAAFLTDLLGHSLGSAAAGDAQKHLRICDDLEAVSDYITQILKLQLRLGENQLAYDERQTNSLLDLHQQVNHLFPLVHAYFREPDSYENQLRVRAQGQEVTICVRQLRSEHWRSLSGQPSPPLVSTTYSDMLVAYRKIKEHLCSVAEAVAGAP